MATEIVRLQRLNSDLKLKLADIPDDAVALVVNDAGEIVNDPAKRPKIYTSFIEAWRWAMDGETVKLVADATMNVTAIFNGQGGNSSSKAKYRYYNPSYTGYQVSEYWTNTIDLNGHTLEWTKTTSNGTAFSLSKGNTLIIKGPGQFVCSIAKSFTWFQVGDTYFSAPDDKAGHLLIEGDVNFVNRNTNTGAKDVRHALVVAGTFKITTPVTIDYFNVETDSTTYLDRTVDINCSVNTLRLSQSASPNNTKVTINGKVGTMELIHNQGQLAEYDQTTKKYTYTYYYDVNTYAGEKFSADNLSYTINSNATTSNEDYQDPYKPAQDYAVIQNVEESQISNITWQFYNSAKLIWWKGDRRDYSYLVKLVYEDGKYLLRKSTIKPAVSFDPNAGDSEATTFEKAVQIANDQNTDTVFVKNTIIVSKDEVWDSDFGLTLMRYTEEEGLKGEMVIVKNGAKLILRGVTLDGGSTYQVKTEYGQADFDAQYPMIRVEAGGTLVIADGATLKNNKNANLTLEARSDKYNIVNLGLYGGGAVNNHGTVIMTGGTITNCTASFGGGIYNEGTLWMTGGNITGNKASIYAPFTAYAEDKYCDGGGVMNSRKNAVMYFVGGIISGNSAKNGGGISVGTGYFSNFSGARLYMMPINELIQRSIVTDVPDEISVNSIALDLGSNDAGPIIDGNTATENGGGIMVASGNTLDGGGSKAYITVGTISNNRASGNTFRGSHIYLYPGGGIYVNGQRGTDNGQLFLENVEIAYNYSAYSGGAIATCPSSNVRIYLTNGGIMHDNTAVQGSTVSIESGSYDKPSHSGYPNIVMSAFMLGGGAYEWEGELSSTKGSRHKLTVNEYGNVKVESGYYGTTCFYFYTDASESGRAANDIRNGVALSKVHIINNRTTAGSGGGIGANGDIQIGTSEGVLRVEKRVEGNDAQPHTNEEFTFTIQLPSRFTKVKMMKNGVWCSDLELSSGIGTFTMKDKDVVIFFDIPAGTQYTITETETGNAEHVIVKYTDTSSTVAEKDLTVQSKKSVTENIVDKGVPTSLVFVNTYDTIEIQVEKNWVVEDESKLPGSVIFRLYTKDGDDLKDSGKYVVMTREDWKNHTVKKFENLPSGYEYVVAEDNVDGYAEEHRVDPITVTTTSLDPKTGTNYTVTQVTGYKWTFTNTEVTKITINKVWNDEGFSNLRPSKILFGLYRNGTRIDEYEMTPKKQGDKYIWPEGEFNNLPTSYYDYGLKQSVPYEYTVKEELDGYNVKCEVFDIVAASMNNGGLGGQGKVIGHNWVFTNTPETIKIEVEKIWNDSNLLHGEDCRPGKIVFNLYRDDEEEPIQTYEMTPNENGKWPSGPVEAFKELSKYHFVDDKLTPYEYSVQEETIEGYTIKSVKQTLSEATYDRATGMVSGSITYDRWTFTNTPETVKIGVSKWWMDDGDTAGRPDQLVFELLRDGKKIDEYVMEPDKNGNWPSKTFEPLPKYHYDADGKAIEYEYEIVEQKLDGYSTEVRKDEITETTASYSKTDGYSYTKKVLGYTYVFTNTQDTIKIQVEKKWAGNSVNRPGSITFDLYRDGKLYDGVEPYVLKPDETGKWPEGPVDAFKSLLRYYYVNGVLTAYNYEVKERAVTGYSATSSKTNIVGEKTDSEPAPFLGYKWTFTNTPETIEINVTKHWDDKGYESQRPDKIDFQLLRDNEVIETKSMTRNADGTWPTITFENLLKYHYDSDGKAVAYEYTVKEGSVTGYTVKDEHYPIIEATLSQGIGGVGKTVGYNWVFTNTHTPPPPEETPAEPTPSQPDEPTPSQPDEPTPSQPDEPTPSQPDEPTPSQPDEPTPSQPDEPTPTPPTNPPTPDNPPPEENDRPNEPQNPNEPDTPEDNPNQDIPNRDVPQEDAPNVPDEPNVPNPQENNPNQDMPNQDTPLDDRPGQPDTPNDEPGTDLPDEDVPQSDTPPRTGETVMNLIWLTMMVASGAGIVLTALSKKREEA